MELKEARSLKKYIPNLLTCSRLLFLGFIIWLLLEDNFSFKLGQQIITNYHIIAACYFFGGLTDVFDGMLARRWQVESSYGDLLDHGIDKLFVGPAIYLLWKHLMSPLLGLLLVLELVIVMIALEILINKLKGRSKQKDSANIYGKITYGFLIGAACVVLLAAKWPPYWPAFRYIAEACLFIAVSLRILSLMKYSYLI